MKYLAIDVGGTFVKHALITDTGIQNGGREKTITKSLAEFEEQLLTIIQYYQKETVEGIGFSVPGKVDSKTGILYHGGALPFLHHYSLIKQISKKVTIPIKVENDAKAACLAEWNWGNLRDTTSGLILVLGTALGAGIISQGKLLTGPHQQAGEISYQILDRSLISENSFAGNQGSSVQLIKRLRDVLSEEKKSDSDLFTMIEGNSAAKSVLQEYCNDLAKIIFNTHVLLDLEKIVIGGGISHQTIVLDYLIAAFTRLYGSVESIQQTFEVPAIETAHFLSEANLYGSILPLLSEKEIKNVMF